MLGNGMDNEEMYSVAKGRGQVYHLLATLFLKEISGDVLKVLRGKEVTEALKELGADVEKMLPSIPQEKLLDELAAEYAALFIIGGGVSPYESVRLKGLLCQEPEWNVRDFYKRCGLEVKEDRKIFSDHIGLELEFMGYLADKEADGWMKKKEKQAAEWNDVQKEFFAKHLNKWVFAFLKDFDKLTFHPFYKELGALTQRFLDMEKTDFGIEAEEAQLSP